MKRAVQPPSADVFKAMTPRTTRIVDREEDRRIELPFSLTFENLIYIGLVACDSWHVGSHYHDHFELCYVEEGSGWFTVNDLCYHLQRGDLFLTRPGEIHQGAADPGSNFRLYYLGFQLEKMSSLEMGYYRVGLHWVVRTQDSVVHDLFGRMFAELVGECAHALEMVQAYFLQLLVSVLRLYESALSPQLQSNPPVLSPALRQVFSYLHNESAAYRTIDDLASQVHLSRSHLTREFKDYMGVSLGHYMRMLQLERARLYLRESSESISAISERLQFPSIHTFSIFFKRHTGLSPHEYRKQVAQTEQHDESNV